MSENKNFNNTELNNTHRQVKKNNPHFSLLLKQKIEEGFKAPYEELFSLAKEYIDLIEKGAHIDTQTEKGDTLLHLCSARDFNLRPDFIVKRYHPNPFIKNKKGLTAAEVAAISSNGRTSRFLLAYEGEFTARRTAEGLEQLSAMIHFLALEANNNKHPLPQAILTPKNILKKVIASLRGDPHQHIDN